MATPSSSTSISSPSSSMSGPGRSRSGRGGPAEGRARRYRWLYVIIGVAFAGLLGRLWYLQVLHGERYYQASTENIVRDIEQEPPRGRIFDRHGIKLAANRTAFDVIAVPHILKRHDVDEVLGRLRHHLSLTEKRVERLAESIEKTSSELRIRSDITRKQVAALETDKLNLPGVEVKVHAKRVYPLDSVFAHTVGFMGEVNGKELRKLEAFGYGPGDYIGRMGLERAFEETLRGSPGIERQVVNARGIPQGEAATRMLIGDYQQVDAVPGRDMVSTLDAELQLAAHEAMRGYPSGSIVALDPKDGSILAMYSKPSFNPNSWSGRLSSLEKMQTDNDPFKPMLDKSVNAYFPGSVFKIVGSWAALARGVADVEDEVNCPGYYRYGGRRFRCWKWGGHGEVDLAEAIQHSCDVFFYDVAAKLGIDPIAEHAFKFGFGERTGLPINNESAGRIPTREWHRKHSPDGYQRGFALNAVLGQGNVMTTPLQVALSYGAVANGGTIWYPRLIDRIQTGEGRVIFEFEPRARKRVGISEEHLAPIREGLRKVVNEEEGTAYDARLEGIPVAGKTGTAQVHSIGRVRIPNRDKMYQLRDHAWFASYAPADDPEVVVVVFLEHAGHGGKEAAPVAADVLRAYFGLDDDVSLARKVGAVAPEEEAR